MGIIVMKKSIAIAYVLMLLVNTHATAQSAQQMVLLLPFCAKLSLDNTNHSNAQLSKLSREYYQGALIALDSFEKRNAAIQVSVFDTNNDSLTLVGILKKPELKKANIIFGPIMQGGNKVMADYAKNKSVFHVSPLMTFSKTQIADPNLILPNPNLTSYPSTIINYIDKQSAQANIVVITDKGASISNVLTPVFKQYATQRQERIKFLDMASLSDLSKQISISNNHIVVLSSNETKVHQALAIIKDTSVLNKCAFWGWPQWLDFKNPDYRLWEQTHVIIPTPYFIDYSRHEVKHFISAYRERFFTEPSEASFKGYDQMWYFGKQLIDEGKLKVDKLMQPQELLHNTFQYKKAAEKEGYQNMQLNLITIENLTFKKINQ
jgi:hypothetical protein